MKIGDIVEPIPGRAALRSGCGSYGSAICISADPFILSSWGADMKWSATVKPEDFRKIGTAPAGRLRFCKRRLKY